MSILLKFILNHKREALIVVLSVLVVLMFGRLKHQKTEVNRLSNNQESLLQSIRFYKTKDSLSAASVGRLQLSVSEFKKHEERLNETIKNLNIKVRRLQSVSNTGIQSNYNINLQIKDSTIINGGHLSKLKCINYDDKWISLHGCMTDSLFNGTIITRDSLTQIVHRIPHRFLFIKWGIKSIRQEIISSNPYSQITYSKYIELKK